MDSTPIRWLVRAIMPSALVVSFLLVTAPASAQAPGGAEPPKKTRPNNVERSRDIEFLFGALKVAPDADSAKLVESRILSLWGVSGSDTADLLMTRVKTAADAKEFDLAIELLDAVIELNPNYVEGWNRRATVYFLNKDYERALTDLRQVLAREPRHFAALAGLGVIMQELGDEKRALDIFRRALEVHPNLPRIPDLVKDLTEKVEGRPI